MPGWLGAILAIAFFAMIGWGWESMKEQLEKKAETSKAAEHVMAAGEATSDGARWLLQKGLGVVAGAAGVFLAYMLFSGDFSWQVLVGAPLLIGYAIYLLLPGQRSFWIIL